MVKVAEYSLEEQKSLGAFYTPAALAEYLAKATLSLSRIDKSKRYVVFDPATCESAL